ncbi:hypothetical protein KDW49_22375 [Burkholderia dolosa]|uniref:hypothetical protein n=1 Tax=Burkholderia dolosa TaxID=152500 RepID=UPI001B9DF66B|nr:hypothetical protein [Burkholderia dolosa]MBR8303458.1 hypothetical protein [Burkholderia dolosa]
MRLRYDRVSWHACDTQNDSAGKGNGDAFPLIVRACLSPRHSEEDQTGGEQVEQVDLAIPPGDAAAAAEPAIAIDTAALRLLRWAHTNDLLRPDAWYPGEAYENPALDPIQLQAIADLRRRRVNFVGVNHARSEVTIYMQRAVPAERVLKTWPKTVDGYRLRYRQGVPTTVTAANVAETATPCAMHVVGGSAFYTCGSSISIGNNREAGTLGCLVRDAAGDLFGLTNNHVSAACNYAPTGQPILAPGVCDVGPANPAPFTIGFHTRQLPMHMGDPTTVNVVDNDDAAIFRIADGGRVSSSQQNVYDTPAAAIGLAAGMQVEKVGRSSGHTRGIVVDRVMGPLPVGYHAAQYGFNGTAFFEPMFIVVGLGDRFSEGGDSGSLVVHTDATGTKYAVGIVIAGRDDGSVPGGKLSLIMPIQPILTKLGVTLVSGHNV